MILSSTNIEKIYKNSENEMCRESVLCVSLTIYDVRGDSYCTTYGTLYTVISTVIFFKYTHVSFEI